MGAATLARIAFARLALVSLAADGLALARFTLAGTRWPDPGGLAPLRIALIAAAVSGLAVIARAQAVPDGFTPTWLGAPGTGDTSLGGSAGGLRERIAAAFAVGHTPPAADPNAPAWTITPAIEVEQEWTDNATQTSSGKRSSLITVVQPSIAISGGGERLRGSLIYAPELDYYPSLPSQTRIGQNLDAHALVTLVPEQLFLDLRGFAAQQALNGATAPFGSTAIARNNDIQTYSFSAEPYLVHRFGGWGSARIGGIVSETAQTLVNSGFGNGGSQTLNTRQEYASFASGEEFGRLSGRLDLSASQFNGGGALRDAHRNVASYQAGYAITHGIVALASIGWEDIDYSSQGGGKALRFNDATWSVGTRLTPNPDSSILLAYGHQNGVTGPAVEASYALTPRTRLYVHYATGISTDAEALQNGFAGAVLDPLGNPVDALTGAPLGLTNNFYGLSGSVYRSRDLSATLSWLYDRDAAQLTFSRQKRTPLGDTLATLIAGNSFAQLTSGAFVTSGTTGSLAWQHELKPWLSSNLYVQYGTLTTTTPLTLIAGTLRLGAQRQQDVRLLVVSTGLNWRVSPTLNASLRYSYTNDDYGAGQPGIAANLVALGLRKTF